MGKGFSIDLRPVDRCARQGDYIPNKHDKTTGEIDLGRVWQPKRMAKKEEKIPRKCMKCVQSVAGAQVDVVDGDDELKIDMKWEYGDIFCCKPIERLNWPAVQVKSKFKSAQIVKRVNELIPQFKNLPSLA
nr:hypothetical protein Iba_chr03dCG5010 [Ipomoea batatas]